MFDKVDKRFEYLMSLITRNDTPSQIVEKAYKKAKELHYYQKRKDGTPYLSHPLEVAIILAELGFDEDTICGALLHDTIEDSGYTKEEMKQDFNENISQMVDAVSAIDKTKYVYNKKNIYEDPNFVKSSAEEQTFKKLISIGKKNPCGFCIKFADRLHNLRTISTFDYNKQLEKVRETEKWILPIARALKAEYFYVQIKNECFKIVQKPNGKDFFDQYDMYHSSNRNSFNNILFALKELFSQDIVKNVYGYEMTEKKVYDEVLKIKPKLKISKITQGQILLVQNYIYYIVYDNSIDESTMRNMALARLNKNFNNLHIVDAKISNFSGYPYFILIDENKNLIRVQMLLEDDFQKLRVGTLDGRFNDYIDEEDINKLDIDFINVKTKTGEIKQIAKDSTALDFAFKIHKDIGFAFKYAIINDSKTKFPPYTKLNEDDKVEIVVEKDENGELKNNVMLRWLAYVNTEGAKRILIRYFEEEYEPKDDVKDDDWFVILMKKRGGENNGNFVLWLIW